MDYAATRGLGISSFVSVGNKADISGNDLLNYWESDPRTDVILLYLESFGNPRKFARIARRMGKTKPVVAVKSGRSAAGVRATSSHTGALLAASDVTVEALFRQAGVIRTDTLEELFDVATLLANQPLAAGRGVGIVTNAGGPAILCADACEAAELKVPVLANETQAQLRAFLPAAAGVSNPVDMIATATGEQYRPTIAAVAADPQVDAVIVLFIRPLATRSDDVADAILDAARALDGTKPVLAVFMSGGAPPELRAGDFSVPSYGFPEAPAVALGHTVRYAEWRNEPIRVPPRLVGLRRDDAAALIARALGKGVGWLEAREVAELLACYGLRAVEQRSARTPEEAATAAEQLGGALALKGFIPGVLHKTEAGLVRLDLRGASEVRSAAAEMAARALTSGASTLTYLVQRMAPRGIEMIVGLVHDLHFGPVVACGAGGVLVELLKDVAMRLTPLAREDASEMVRSLKTFPLLEGYRGGPAYEVAALEDALLRISAMAEDLPQVAELDLNPVVVLQEGAVILDARVRLEASEPAGAAASRFVRAGPSSAERETSGEEGATR